MPNEETMSIEGTPRRGKGAPAEPVDDTGMDAGGDDAKAGRTAEAEQDDDGSMIGTISADGEDVPPRKINDDEDAAPKVKAVNNAKDLEADADDDDDKDEIGEAEDQPEEKAPAKAPAKDIPGDKVFKIDDAAIADLSDIIGSEQVDRVIKPLVERLNYGETLLKQAHGEVMTTQYKQACHARIDRLNDPMFGDDSEDLSKDQTQARDKLIAKAESLYEKARNAGKPISGPKAIKKAADLLTATKQVANGQTRTINRRPMAGVVSSKPAGGAPEKRSYAKATRNLELKIRDMLGA